MIKWYLYDVLSNEELNGVMLRGRIRKFGIESEIDVIDENTEDRENGVRFVVTDRESGAKVSVYIQSVIGSVTINELAGEVLNPVLSKLKVNQEDRYIL